jgi:hypothetical protein
MLMARELDPLKLTSPRFSEAGGNKAASAAMANLADAVHGLVQQMRVEQQTIRDWVDSQAARHREIKDLLQARAPRGEVVSSIPQSARNTVEEKT